MLVEAAVVVVEMPVEMLAETEIGTTTDEVATELKINLSHNYNGKAKESEIFRSFRQI